MKELSPNKQMVINLSSSILVFVLNALISFLLSPVIVKTLGVEANGFIQLGNNFVSYAALITMALNSMSSRFITVELHRNHEKKAEEYYSSTFVGNLVLLALMLVPIILIICFLEHLIQISPHLITQVKVLFLFLFINYFISTGTPTWNVAFFSSNRIYLQSLGSILSNVIRATTIVILFVLFPAKVWFIGIASVMATITNQIWFYNGKKKLLPNMSFHLSQVKREVIVRLLSSGVWNAISQLGVLLFSGMDLLMGNIFIDGKSMGLIALAKVIPNLFGSLINTVMSTFTPNFTILYAKGEIDYLVSEIKKCNRIATVLVGIPFAGFLAFGQSFFSLWVPQENADILQLLSILSCVGMVYSIGIYPLFQIFTVLDRNKPASMTLIFGGIINVIVTYILLQTTNLGMYAICATSTVINLFRNMLFTVPFSAKFLGLKWQTFFPMVLRTIVSITVLYLIGSLINHFVVINSWLRLLYICAVFGVSSLIISLYLILVKSDRKMLFGYLRDKLGVS